MENRYKIKEEYKKLINKDRRDLEYTKRGIDYYSYPATNSGLYFEGTFTDELFEKVEEEPKRIELVIQRSNEGNDYIRKSDRSEITEEEIEIMNKAINGELVEKEKKQGYDLELYIKKEKIREWIKDNAEKKAPNLMDLIEILNK